MESVLTTFTDNSFFTTPKVATLLYSFLSDSSERGYDADAASSSTSGPVMGGAPLLSLPYSAKDIWALPPSFTSAAMDTSAKRINHRHSAFFYNTPRKYTPIVTSVPGMFKQRNQGQQQRNLKSVQQSQTSKEESTSSSSTTESSSTSSNVASAVPCPTIPVMETEQIRNYMLKYAPPLFVVMILLNAMMSHNGSAISAISFLVPIILFYWMYATAIHTIYIGMQKATKERPVVSMPADGIIKPPENLRTGDIFYVEDMLGAVRANPFLFQENPYLLDAQTNIFILAYCGGYLIDINKPNGLFILIWLLLLYLEFYREFKKPSSLHTAYTVQNVDNDPDASPSWMWPDLAWAYRNIRKFSFFILFFIMFLSSFVAAAATYPTTNRKVSKGKLFTTSYALMLTCSGLLGLFMMYILWQLASMELSPFGQSGWGAKDYKVQAMNKDMLGLLEKCNTKATVTGPLSIESFSAIEKNASDIITKIFVNLQTFFDVSTPQGGDKEEIKEFEHKCSYWFECHPPPVEMTHTIIAYCMANVADDKIKDKLRESSVNKSGKDVVDVWLFLELLLQEDDKQDAQSDNKTQITPEVYTANIKKIYVDDETGYPSE